MPESHARIKIAGRNIYNLKYTDNSTLMAEGEEELLDKSERRTCKMRLQTKY